MSHIHADRQVRATSGSTVRRFRGATSDELFLLCRPGEGATDAARQAESLYDALLGILSSEGAGPQHLATETLFFRHVRKDYEVVRDARLRVLGQRGFEACRSATTFIGQPPLDEHARLELSAVAVIPHQRNSRAVTEVSRSVSCSCNDCRQGVRARLVRTDDETIVHAANLHGKGAGGVEEAYGMFRVAEDLLREAGMTFRDVVRTWIYLRDIDRDYEALNQARREFFRDSGVERKPASTGVEGTPLAGAHDFSMSLYAVKSQRPLEVTQMSTPTLNEAWTYGADFSRGLKVADANKTTLYVSGTASIDEEGRSVHPGDFDAQAERMVRNIESLLAQQGATFGNLCSAITYLKNPADAPALRALFGRRGFDGFPCVFVEAPLCRPELLCETEAVAILPLTTRA